ncbi:MAG TPA: 50S ribosomal protein L25 [Dehalococcoidia bacterium]|nr:50S ribosomal protein L25 [Dehalococcoidia bacterium]
MAARTELKVAPREVLGKKVKALRRQGFTPANIFGHHVDSKAVQVPTEELSHTLKTLKRNEIVYLRLDGEEARPAFVKHLQHNPVTDVILHVDFLQISLKEKVRLEVPLHFTGLAPAIDRHGGVLVTALDHISVEALPTEVPSFIEVDVSGLEEIDQSLHVSDLKVPEGATVLSDPELVIVKAAAPAIERAAAAEEAAEEAEKAEAAAAAAAEAGEAPAEEAAEE